MSLTERNEHGKDSTRCAIIEVVNRTPIVYHINKEHNMCEAEQNSYKTAITRKKLSAPMRLLVHGDHLKGNVLDYGCGKGSDADKIGLDKYDPHYFPMTGFKDDYYDTITCHYVLNTVSEHTAEDIMHDIIYCLKEGGTAYITVRRDLKQDSIVTKRGTLQRNVKLTLPVLHETTGYCIYILTK